MKPCDNPSVSFVPKYCCLQATEPVIVAQYTLLIHVEMMIYIGGPFLSIIPPVVQYLKSYIIPPQVNVIAWPIIERHVSITVNTNYFDTNCIFFDGTPLEPNTDNWQAIYCAEGDIFGYATNRTLDDSSHYIYHTDEKAAIFVYSYGFRDGNSYGLIGGMELQAIGGE